MAVALITAAVVLAAAPETTEASVEALLKSLAADQRLAERAPDAVVVVVLFRLGDSASEAEKNQAMSALRAVAPRVLQGRKVLVSELDYRGPAPLIAALRARHATALFLTSGFEPELKRVTAVTRAAAVTSFGLGSAYVRGGVSVGVEARAGGEQVVLNLTACKSEGMALDPKALGAEAL